MYCKECGKEIDHDSKFCSYCGTKQSIQPTIEQREDQVIKSSTTSQTINVNLNLGRPKVEGEKVNKEQVNINKYNLTYKKDVEATIIGLVIVVTGFFMFYIGGLYNNVANPEVLKPLLVLLICFGEYLLLSGL